MSDSTCAWRRHARSLLPLALVLVLGAQPPAMAQARVIGPNTVNLTVGELVAAMADPSPAQSDAIDMYLLGIFDLTEGDAWCSYPQFKAGTLREEVYHNLHTLQGDALSQRAAPAVRTALNQRFPCRN